MIQDSVQSGFVPELVRAMPLFLRPFPSTHSISRGAGIGDTNNWALGESPRALQEVHQTQETHQFFTCTVPQRLSGVVVFTEERVNGEESAQATVLLEIKKGAVSENYLADASRQALHTQSVLKSPLEAPEPRVRGATSMLHTNELITETCHESISTASQPIRGCKTACDVAFLALPSAHPLT